MVCFWHSKAEAFTNAAGFFSQEGCLKRGVVLRGLCFSATNTHSGDSFFQLVKSWWMDKHGSEQQLGKAIRSGMRLTTSARIGLPGKESAVEVHHVGHDTDGIWTE